MNRLRWMLRRATCRLFGHVPPDEAFALTVSAMLGSMGPRHCQRCRLRMPGDPPTLIEQQIAQVARTFPLPGPSAEPRALGGPVSDRLIRVKVVSDHPGWKVTVVVTLPDHPYGPQPYPPAILPRFDSQDAAVEAADALAAAYRSDGFVIESTG